jgi:hemolysin D
MNDLSDAEKKVDELGQDLVKAEQKTSEQVLRSPIDGTVQQLALHTVGGVVTAARQLMIVVPSNSRLEAEAMISNRDIGFVSAGQSAEAKVDTFNFTRYGLLQGKVVSVSQDAIVQDKPNAKGGAPYPAERCPIRASLRGRNYSIQRGFRSIKPRCRWRTRWSSSRRAWL